MIEELLTTVYDPIKLKYPAINFDNDDDGYFEEDLFDLSLRFTGIVPTLNTEKISTPFILPNVDFSVINPYRKSNELIIPEMTEEEYNRLYGESGKEVKTSKENKITSSIKDRAKYLMKRLLSEVGMTKELAAGFAGNILQESGFNPLVKPGDGGKALGIAQWHSDRRVGLDMNKMSYEDLVSHIINELKTTEKSALRKIKLTKTVKDAAIATDRFYERSAGKERKQRINYAEKFAKIAKKGGKL